MAVGDVWYRIEDYRTAAPLNEWDEPIGRPTPRARLLTYWMVRETPKGVWLLPFWGNKKMPNQISGKKPSELVGLYIIRPRFQLHESNRRFACPTMEEALASFEARKARQVSIYQARIASIEGSLRAARAGRFGG